MKTIRSTECTFSGTFYMPLPRGSEFIGVQNNGVNGVILFYTMTDAPEVDTHMVQVVMDGGQVESEARLVGMLPFGGAMLFVFDTVLQEPTP